MSLGSLSVTGRSPCSPSARIEPSTVKETDRKDINSLLGPQDQDSSPAAQDPKLAIPLSYIYIHDQAINFLKYYIRKVFFEYYENKTKTIFGNIKSALFRNKNLRSLIGKIGENFIQFFNLQQLSPILIVSNFLSKF